MRYFLRLSFKGTAYSGWQIQENAITVQEVLNKALNKLISGQAETTGCGRTDTGVHASQFYVHFDTQKPLAEKKQFLYSLNAILPGDIVISDLIQVEDSAHARFDATSRKYKYFISKAKNPFLKEYVMFSNINFSIDEMNIACELMQQHHDFSSFSKSNTQVKTNNCKIMNAHWGLNENLLIFSITADRFLRGMVRAIVGTMLDIGTGKMNAADIHDIIKSKNRSEAGTSAPASGLFLTEVTYPFIPAVEEQKMQLHL